MSITMDQGRAALVHFRDELELSNRDLARVFQDHITPDKFVDFMLGDNSAISQEQAGYVGNEIAGHIKETQRMGFDPTPGFLKAMGVVAK